MQFLTNKHVITAFIVTPILAVLGYYAVDLMVKEQPHRAVPGASYPLAAQSNCRYTSGQCDLKNADFVASVKVEEAANGSKLVVSSDHALSAVHVGFSRIDSSEVIDPQLMASDDGGKTWQLSAPLELNENTLMMIVMQANDVKYYADTTMAFSEYQTSFNKKF